MSWAEATEAFKANFPNYEERAPQTVLATAIERVMQADAAAEERVALLAEAPTGVGKSYAALVTAVDASLACGLPSVVVTGTKALQTQYLGDLETLARIWRKFRYTLLKGKSNYGCLAKIADLSDSDVTFSLAALNTALAEPDADGDIDHLDITVTPQDRQKITTTTEECPGRNQCPFGDTCFTYAARDRASEAQVVVANHALLGMDAQMHEGTGSTVGMALPEYGHLVVDEAHTLEDAVTGAITRRITYGGIDAVLREAANLSEDTTLHYDAVPALRSFFDKLAEILPYKTTRDDKIITDRNGVPVRESAAAITPEMLVELADEHDAVLVRLRAAHTAVSRVQAFDDRSRSHKNRLLKKIEAQGTRLANIVIAEFDQMVRWIATDDKDRLSIQFTRLDVGVLLNETVWSQHQTTFLSATLAMRKNGVPDFGFVAGRLGLAPGTYQTCVTDHVFDYPNQARTFVPAKDSMDAGQKQSHSNEAMIATRTLVEAAGGRALLLYTSRVEMNNAHRMIAPVLGQLGIRVLKQGDMGNRELARTFAADETSVLFALKSFFTGFDVKGDSLRLVVINKLPFPNPADIVFKAKSEIIDRHSSGFADSGFMKLTVPTMALEILQGYGRLIRSLDDRGVVAILDSRLRTKASYGSVILGALPPAPVTDSVAEITEYLQSLDAKAAV